MRLTIKSGIAALLLSTGLFGAAAAAPAQVADTPPAGEGPRGTSQAVLGAERYDAIGYAVPNDGSANPGAISAAHPTLPIGSFAEVTAIDSGKTILVVIAEQGLATPDRIIALSPGALQLLGRPEAAALGVRVRRVNPLGADQQALRDGRPASARIDAPAVLLAALRKRLPAPPRGVSTAMPRPPRATNAAVNLGAGAGYPVPGRAAAPPVKPATSRQGTGFFVQVAALSNGQRASDLANSLAGSVMAGGGLYRVRLGPFPDQASADRARADAVQRGFGDARIIHE